MQNRFHNLPSEIQNKIYSINLSNIIYDAIIRIPTVEYKSPEKKLMAYKIYEKEQWKKYSKLGYSKDHRLLKKIEFNWLYNLSDKDREKYENNDYNNNNKNILPIDYVFDLWLNYPIGRLLEFKNEEEDFVYKIKRDWDSYYNKDARKISLLDQNNYGHILNNLVGYISGDHYRYDWIFETLWKKVNRYDHLFMISNKSLYISKLKVPPFYLGMEWLETHRHFCDSNDIFVTPEQIEKASLVFLFWKRQYFNKELFIKYLFVTFFGPNNSSESNC